MTISAMTKQEFHQIFGINDTEESVRSWRDLSHDDKTRVVAVLKENGFENAVQVIEDFDYQPERYHFPCFYLILDGSDVTDFQTYF